MRILAERVATPREIAVELEEPINNVAYHIKILRKLECIELVRTRQAHGGRVAEHLYRATQRPYWDDSAWEQLEDVEKLDVTAAIMQQISEDIAEAMSHGTFHDPDDNHLSRSPMIVDQDGWQEVLDLLAETMEGLMAIQTRVNARRNKAEEPVYTTVEIIQFRSPTPKTPERARGSSSP